jgi:hypothetical protein
VPPWEGGSGVGERRGPVYRLPLCEQEFVWKYSNGSESWCVIHLSYWLMKAPGFISRHRNAFKLTLGPLGDKGGHTIHTPPPARHNPHSRPAKPT